MTFTSKTPLSQIYPKSIPEASGKHLGIRWAWCPISLLGCWQCIFTAVHSFYRRRSHRIEKSYLSVSGTEWDSQIYPKFWDTFPTSMSRPPLYHSYAASPPELVARLANTSPESHHAGHARVVLLGFGGGRGGVLAETHTPKATGAGDCVSCSVSGMESVSWHVGVGGAAGERKKKSG